MIKFWREPLVHFLVGALAVFAFFWATGLDRSVEDKTIIIDQSGVERLAAEWKRNYNRLPTQAELDALIDSQVAEEIYYREALRLGLDRDDPVVRRRLSTKMRFLEEEDADLEPTDAQLKKWLNDNAARYAEPGAIDLEQIYIGQGAPPAKAQLQSILDGLNAARPNAPEMAKKISQNISLPEQIKDASPGAITREFGEKFWLAVQLQPTGKWVGPVQSSFGNHLVKYSQVDNGAVPALVDIRQRVSNNWRRAEVEKLRKSAIAKLRARYDIQVAGRE